MWNNFHTCTKSKHVYDLAKRLDIDLDNLISKSVIVKQSITVEKKIDDEFEIWACDKIYAYVCADCRVA